LEKLVKKILKNKDVKLNIVNRIKKNILNISGKINDEIIKDKLLIILIRIILDNNYTDLSEFINELNELYVLL
jgi:hypothetical protein